jgi:release factor glutamine methyltransferase
VSIAQALRDAAARLEQSSDTPRLDAELLLAHALGMDRNDLLLCQRELAVPPGYDVLIERRLAGQPIAYITGTRDFWTISLHVTPDVLIPRPDTETLIEAAIDHFRSRAPARIARSMAASNGTGRRYFSSRAGCGERQCGAAWAGHPRVLSPG